MEKEATLEDLLPSLFCTVIGCEISFIPTRLIGICRASCRPCTSSMLASLTELLFALFTADYV